MTTYFVTRHPGAVAWAEAEGIPADEVVSHLEPALLEPGDIVVGTLPVNLAAEVCATGCRYIHLSMRIPAERRGMELSPEELDEFGAHLREYRVVAVV